MTPRGYFIRKAKKSKAGKDALTKLNDYINANTAAPMYWLNNMWVNQQNAITYKELREAIKNGYMDEKTLQAWQQDYAKFVVNRLAPEWQKAAAAGAAATASKATGGWIFDAGSVGITRHIAAQGARFVTSISDESRAAIQALIGAGTTGQYTVDELARAIRPLVGLTQPQASANLKYYTQVRDHLLSSNPTMKQETAEKRAKDAAMKYAAKQHRYRAYTIATTETAAAYINGNREFVRQAIAKGYMGRGVWVWDTAADEVVCEACGTLNGAETDMDAWRYSVGGQIVTFKLGQGPPAHPRCRCGEHFEEREPPAIQTDELDRLRAMPEQMRVTELGGADGGRQRAAVVETVMTDDIDLDSLYHARVYADFDNANYTVTIRTDVTLKPLTELAKAGIMTVSEAALQHSTIGTYNSAGRIIGGCHTEAGMQELTRRSIEYVIDGAFTNGVRLGHITSHKDRFKRQPKQQAFFPVEWDDDMILKAGTAVANSDAPLQMGYHKVGEYMGVMVRVLFKTDGSGEIASVCPDYDQQVLKGVDFFE